VFATANNHSFDLGRLGVAKTRELTQELQQTYAVQTNGLKAGEGEPIQITAIHLREWRIGFVAITSFSNVGGSFPYVNLVDYTKEEVAQLFLSQVEIWDSEFDLLIVSVHSGMEYVQSPDPTKVGFFRDLVAHGADIVWGHHPHVLQPWETVRHRGATKLIMYSAGNFISAQRRLQQPFISAGRWAPTGDAALFQVIVSGDEPSVSSVLTPVFSIVRDTEHGLVLKTFGEILTGSLPIAWRSFYLVRFAQTRALMDNHRTGFLYRRIHPGTERLARR
jgi:poly-gamma-glutamate synthesis protein (capsule biosynthesis protein)